MDFIPVTPRSLARHLAYCFLHDIIPIVWGKPGIGKSQILEQAAAQWLEEPLQHGKNFIDFRANLHDPVDLIGVPSVEGGMTRWNPPDMLPREGRGVFDIEELPNAHRAMQAALYPLLYHPHRIGDYFFPKDWRIAITGNRLEDGGGTFDMPTPLKNRLRHFELDVSTDEWISYGQSQGFHPGVLGFIAFKPNMLCMVDHQMLAFPTPRTWEMVSDDLINLEPDAPPMDLLQSSVGTGAAHEISAFLESTVNLPTIEQLLKNPALVKGYLDDMGKLYAILSNLVYAAGETEKRFNEESDPKGARQEAVYQLFRVTEPMELEFQTFFMRGIGQINDAFLDHPKLQDWQRDNAEMML